MPTAALKIARPWRYSVALSVARSTTSRVSTTFVGPRAALGIQPLELFGRTGSRTLLHTRPVAGDDGTEDENEIGRLFWRFPQELSDDRSSAAGSDAGADVPQDSRPVRGGLAVGKLARLRDRELGSWRRRQSDLERRITTARAVRDENQGGQRDADQQKRYGEHPE